MYGQRTRPYTTRKRDGLEARLPNSDTWIVFRRSSREDEQTEIKTKKKTDENGMRMIVKLNISGDGGRDSNVHDIDRDS